VAANGVVYFASDYLYAVRAATGELVWKQTIPDGASQLAIAKGVLYAGGESNNDLYAVKAATGEILWKYPTGVTRGSIAVANGIVYVGANWSALYALNANNGTFLWSDYTGEGFFSGPVVANGTVYIGSDQYPSHVFAFHLPGQ
jgi:outer membrane protein assembly factor BamB